MNKRQSEKALAAKRQSLQVQAKNHFEEAISLLRSFFSPLFLDRCEATGKWGLIHDRLEECFFDCLQHALCDMHRNFLHDFFHVLALQLGPFALPRVSESSFKHLTLEQAFRPGVLRHSVYVCSVASASSTNGNATTLAALLPALLPSVCDSVIESHLAMHELRETLHRAL